MEAGGGLFSGGGGEPEKRADEGSREAQSRALSHGGYRLSVHGGFIPSANVPWPHHLAAAGMAPQAAVSLQRRYTVAA